MLSNIDIFIRASDRRQTHQLVTPDPDSPCLHHHRKKYTPTTTRNDLRATPARVLLLSRRLGRRSSSYKSEEFAICSTFYNGLGKNESEFEKDVAESVVILHNLCSELLPSLQLYFVLFFLLLFNERVE